MTNCVEKIICVFKNAPHGRKTLRHELIHAFLYESGLDWNTLMLDEPWAVNEEMVDWFAIQSPKIFRVYKELDLL